MKELEKDLLLRNRYMADCNGMPILKKYVPDNPYIKLLSFDKTKKFDYINADKTVHFFNHDYKLEGLYNSPYRYLKKLAQYKSLCTPDYSIYTDMAREVQRYNVFKSRWCGAFWQDFGFDVIPTVTWGDETSFEFCFSGLEKETAVIVSTVGNRKEDKKLFMNGYSYMKKVISPTIVYCYGEPFMEMGREVIYIEYNRFRR